VQCFQGVVRDRTGLTNVSNSFSKHSRTPLHNHHRNTLKSRFVTMSVFRWNSCGHSKCLYSHQGQTFEKPCICAPPEHWKFFAGLYLQRTWGQLWILWSLAKDL